jgi:hypothetical protein
LKTTDATTNESIIAQLGRGLVKGQKADCGLIHNAFCDILQRERATIAQLGACQQANFYP